MSNCLLCMNQAERHHIKSRGSGGGDEPDNIMMLCRSHHIEVHKIGRTSFIKKHELKECMESKNWQFIPFLDKWIYNG